jgi:hypothetical protein
MLLMLSEFRTARVAVAASSVAAISYDARLCEVAAFCSWWPKRLTCESAEAVLGDEMEQTLSEAIPRIKSPEKLPQETKNRRKARCEKQPYY